MPHAGRLPDRQARITKRLPAEGAPRDPHRRAGLARRHRRASPNCWRAAIATAWRWRELHGLQSIAFPGHLDRRLRLSRSSPPTEIAVREVKAHDRHASSASSSAASAPAMADALSRDHRAAGPPTSRIVEERGVRDGTRSYCPYRLAFLRYSSSSSVLRRAPAPRCDAGSGRSGRRCRGDRRRDFSCPRAPISGEQRAGQLLIGQLLAVAERHVEEQPAC